MNKLEGKLAQKFEKKFCVFTGSGTTAIYLTLKALDITNKKVLYPAITCMAPVNAAIYAGYDVIFCDVNLKDCTIDIDSFKKVIDKYDVGVIVPTHIYGHTCNINEVTNIASERGIFVIEDSAQTVSLSRYSDSSVMSFGHTKILETSIGGGAVFTDNENLYKKIREERNILPNKPQNLIQLFNEYRKNYYSIMEEENIDKYIKMYQLQLNSKNTFIYNNENNDELVGKLEDIDKIIKNRNIRRNLYDEYLDNKYICKFDYTGEVLWRYSFLYNGKRDELLKSVREKKIDISSWYISLYKIYSEQNKKYFKNSDYVEEHIVNLWVNPEYEENKIQDDIKEINNIMLNLKL